MVSVILFLDTIYPSFPQVDIIHQSNSSIQKMYELRLDRFNSVNTTIVSITINATKSINENLDDSKHNFQVIDHPNVLKALNPTTGSSKLAFIGIFNKVDNLERRALLRMAYSRIPSQFTLKFVIGRPTNITLKNLINLEQKTYNDILLLNTTLENMNSGKTFDYFKKVWIDYALHDFFLKMDDDAFAVLSNWVGFLQSLDSSKDVYFGRMIQHQDIESYMTGLCYGVSKSLLQYIATDIYPSTHQTHAEPNSIGGVFGEDQVTADWILQRNKTSKIDYKESELFFDLPGSRGGWNEAYRSDALMIHYLKGSDDMVQTVLHYSQL